MNIINAISTRALCKVINLISGESLQLPLCPSLSLSLSLSPSLSLQRNSLCLTD